MNPETTSVTGVLVTGKATERYPLAMNAVKAWLHQDYPGPRNLLVINDHPTEPLFLDKRQQPRSVTEVQVQGKHSLGELRNKAMDIADTDYMIQWDDDDFSHHNRLTYQVENTQQDYMSTFRWEINCNLRDGNRFANNGKSIRGKGFPGTMLWPKTDYRFPDKGKAEDTEFVLHFAKARKLHVIANPPMMYLRFYHGYNTWSQKHVMQRKPGSRDLNQIEDGYVSSVLETHYQDIVKNLQ